MVRPVRAIHEKGWRRIFLRPEPKRTCALRIIDGGMHARSPRGFLYLGQPYSLFIKLLLQSRNPQHLLRLRLVLRASIEGTHLRVDFVNPGLQSSNSVLLLENLSLPLICGSLFSSLLLQGPMRGAPFGSSPVRGGSAIVGVRLGGVLDCRLILVGIFRKVFVGNNLWRRGGVILGGLLFPVLSSDIPQRLRMRQRSQQQRDPQGTGQRRGQVVTNLLQAGGQMGVVQGEADPNLRSPAALRGRDWRPRRGF